MDALVASVKATEDRVLCQLDMGLILQVVVLRLVTIHTADYQNMGLYLVRTAPILRIFLMECFIIRNLIVYCYGDLAGTLS